MRWWMRLLTLTTWWLELYTESAAEQTKSTVATQDVQQDKPALSSIVTHSVDALLKIEVRRCLHYGCGCEAQSCALSLSTHSGIALSRLRVHRVPVSLISLDLQIVRATIWSTTCFSAALLGYWLWFRGSDRNEKTHSSFSLIQRPRWLQWYHSWHMEIDVPHTRVVGHPLWW